MIGGDSTPGEATLEAASDAVPHESNIFESLFDTAADDTLFRRESTMGASSAPFQEEGEVTAMPHAGDTTPGVRDKDTLPPVILRMPNTGFGIAMGLAGHAIMWKGLLSAPFITNRIEVSMMQVLGSICWYASACVGCVVGVCYIYKMFTSYPLVRAEYLNETRCHFFNAPNLIYIMLLIGLPAHMDAQIYTLRILWVPAFIYQIFWTQHIYKAWMFSKRRNFSEAKPQFLLSTVGWFLLSTLGGIAQIKQGWGIGLPAMCFGAGFILYIDIVIFIFGKLHENVGMKGSPAMFLLIAPPSVGVVALDLLNDGASEFSLPAEMLLGWVMVIFLLLIRLGPILWRNPSVFGEFWAYVFPMAAATTATIRYATALGTKATEGLAIIMLMLAISSLLLVLGRTLSYMYLCCIKERYHWRDPLFDIEKFSTGSLCCSKERKLDLESNVPDEHLLNLR